MNYTNIYLLQIQYLGFRFHGWQKQPNLKTVHWAVDKTLKFVCKGIRNKSIGVGRTDAKVSATDFYVQLFIDSAVVKEDFINSFNKNSPADIRLVQIQNIEDASFNIIQHPKTKNQHHETMGMCPWFCPTAAATKTAGTRCVCSNCSQHYLFIWCI